MAKACSWRQPRAIFFGVSTLAEIESAVKALPLSQQRELFQHLAERLNVSVTQGDAYSRNAEQGRQEQFVVLPYEEFVAVQERLADADDLLELRKAKRAEGGENPFRSRR